MTDITFVVPVAPNHQRLLERSLASIEAQTVKCEVLVIPDHDRKGAGATRNKGIAQVTTSFIVFLDADDEVLPQFAELTLEIWQPRRFVYTDWYDLDTVTHAPDCPFINNNRSVITTLIATEDARRVQGFDETLTGMEDTHFYLKLLSSGVCGLHLNEPLFRYHPDGVRSKTFFEDKPTFKATVQRFNAEFGGRPMAECGGCGGSPYAMPEVQNLPIGEPQPGDVLAEALWAGNRQVRGRITGRLYPRASSGKRLWMSPKDIDGAPHEFARVVEMPGVPTESDFQRFAKGVMRQMTGMQASSQPEMVPVTAHIAANTTVKADVDKVLRLFQQSQ